jgi:hypothetical protein
LARRTVWRGGATMARPTEQPLVVIRVALQAAELLTETGEVCGAEVDRPDARLLALLARYDLAWTTFIAIQRKRWRQPGETAAGHKQFAAAEAVAEQVAAIPAATVEGARGKAQLAIARTLGNIDAAAVSALQDALRGPAPPLSPPGGKRRRSRRQPGADVSTAPSEEPLLALIHEYRRVKLLARVDEPYGTHRDQAREEFIRRFIVLHDRLVQTPALSGPGILAKLRATLPSRGTAHKWRPLLRSAMLDMVEFGRMSEA